MADTGERDVRDRIGELVYRYEFPVTARALPWASLSPAQRSPHLSDADALLAIVPTVGLRIGRVEE